MKLLIMMLLSVLTINAVHAQLPGLSFPGDKLKGKISMITTLRYGENINGLYPYKLDTTYRDTTIYDEMGNVASRHVKFGPWGHYSYSNYTYLHKYNNNKLAETTTLTAGVKIVTTYDENGLVAESDRYTDNENVFKDIYTYDEKHNLVRCDSYNSKGRIMQTIYKYNKKHLLQKEVNDGPFPAEETYDFSKFDKEGNWTRCISKRYSEAGILLSTGKPGIGVNTETTIRQITYQN